MERCKFSREFKIEAVKLVRERDAKRTLELTEQVLAQRDGYALVLLQIEFDDE